jgi:hypothetical protein
MTRPRTHPIKQLGGTLRTNHPSRLTALFAAAALVLAASACGSDSDNAADADPVGAATVPAVPDAPTDTGDGAVETSENPIVLGFEVSGPEGTVIEITTVAAVVGGESQESEQTMQLVGEPKWQMFTNWVESAELTLEVTEGGPATIKGFRGNYRDVDDPFVGYVVAEELGTAELPAGEITTFDLP